MFGWLRSLFGSKVQSTGEPLVLSEEQKVTESVMPVVETAPEKEALREVYKADKPKKAKAPKAKKTTKKKATEDFASMTKTQLLALCKERDVKANASLKKDELVARLSE